MQTKTHNSYYRTSDIKIATFLRVKGFKLINVDREANGRGIFVFEDQPGRQELIFSFINRQETLEVVGFLDEMKNLKGLCRG